MEYDESNKNYTLYILMDLAKCALTDYLLKFKKHKIKLNAFFPIFRDTILGLIYMHYNAIAHRDIKPGNILMMLSGKFVLADYGEGINLSGEEKYNENNHNF